MTSHHGKTSSIAFLYRFVGQPQVTMVSIKTKGLQYSQYEADGFVLHSHYTACCACACRLAGRRLIAISSLHSLQIAPFVFGTPEQGNS